MDRYVYHITSSCISDRDDFVPAANIEEAVSKYIDWYSKHQNKTIKSSDILTIQRIGNDLGE